MSWRYDIGCDIRSPPERDYSQVARNSWARGLMIRKYIPQRGIAAFATCFGVVIVVHSPVESGLYTYINVYC